MPLLQMLKVRLMMRLLRLLLLLLLLLPGLSQRNQGPQTPRVPINNLWPQYEPRAVRLQQEVNWLEEVLHKEVAPLVVP